VVGAVGRCRCCSFAVGFRCRTNSNWMAVLDKMPEFAAAAVVVAAAAADQGLSER